MTEKTTSTEIPATTAYRRSMQAYLNANWNYLPFAFRPKNPITLNPNQMPQLRKNYLFEYTAEYQILGITLRRGPWGVAEIFPTDDLPIAWQVEIGLYLFKAWLTSRQARSIVYQYIENDCKVITTNSGLRVLYVPKTLINSKAFRYNVKNIFRNNPIDVIVGCYFDAQTKVQNIGITRIYDHSADGMQELYEELTEMDPEANIYLHDKKAFIYIKKSGLTLDEITVQTCQTLCPFYEDDYESDEIDLEDDEFVPEMFED